MNTMNTQIYEEATEWIILHRSDDLDAEAKRRFDAWVRESPQHLKAYLEMSTIWEDVPTLQHDWNPSANELIARAREDANVVPLGEASFPVIPAEADSGLRPQASGLSTLQEPALQSVRVVTVSASQHSSFGRYAISIAASVLMLVGTGWLYLQRGFYSTDIGEQRTLALEDGSSVELNARTKIRVAYTDQARTIELLQGQALFKVAIDPNRPFIVDSAGTHIRAVGTQFDVYKKDTGTQVTVVEGRVALKVPALKVPGSGVSGGLSRPPNADQAADIDDTTRASTQHASHALHAEIGEVLLSAGEQILITQAAPELAPPNSGTVLTTPETPTPAPLAALTPQPANIEAATAWTQQRLVFDFAPLTEVAQEFNRYNRRPLIIVCNDDRPQASGFMPCLSDFNISGSFSSTDPTLLLRFLREQPGIVVNESDSEIRISRQEPAG